MLRRLITGCVFTFSFIVNPMYFVGGCITDTESRLAWGEADMVALLQHVSDAASYRFTSQGLDYELLLALNETVGADSGQSATRKGSWQAQAFACGQRTFQQSAAACIDSSELLANGDLTLRVQEQGAWTTLIDAAKVKGSLTVRGRLLANAGLWLDADAVMVHVVLDQNDTTNEFRLTELTWDGGTDPTRAVSYRHL
jgi:hypothetical protein